MYKKTITNIDFYQTELRKIVVPNDMLYCRNIFYQCDTYYTIAYVLCISTCLAICTIIIIS